ncbi:MAG TPA: glycosyltransferase family 39 protein [Acidobacteriota bacterium]|jgi:hypothetical protein
MAWALQDSPTLAAGYRKIQETWLRMQKPRLFIPLVLLLQLVFYSVSWNNFFCGDSLYYLSRRTETLGAIKASFLKPDDVGQYRPVTYPVFTFLLYPIGGLSPRRYHIVGFILHALISLGVFGLLRRLLRDEKAAAAGYVFFALHSVAYFISYDASFLPDWLFSTLTLLIIASFLQFLRSQESFFLAVAVGCYAIALLSKETAVMIPVALLALCMLAAESGGGAIGKDRTVLVARLRPVVPFVVLSVIYVLFLVILKGRLDPASPTHPFHLSLHPTNLLSNYKFLLWAFNIDAHFPRDVLEGVHQFLALFQGAAALLFLSFVWKRKTDGHFSLWFLIWAVAFLLPVLLVVEPPYPHHLYMPLVPLSALVGVFVARWPTTSRRKALMVLMAGLNLLMSYLTIWRFEHRSWAPHGSRVAWNFHQAFRRHHPVLLPRSVIHLRKSKEANSIWYFDRHSLLRIFYEDPTLAMRFEDSGEKLPANTGAPIPNYFVYGLWEGNFDLLPDYWQGRNVELLEPALNGQIEEDRAQYYPSFEKFRTPNGGRVFPIYLLRDGERRKTLVTIAGTRLRLPLPEIDQDSVLHVGIASVFDSGDGFEAMLSLERNGKLVPLIDRYLQSARIPDHRHWMDYHLPLRRFAGSGNSLVLECNAGPDKDTRADWLAWSMLKIDKSAFRKLE